MEVVRVREVICGEQQLRLGEKNLGVVGEGGGGLQAREEEDIIQHLTMRSRGLPGKEQEEAGHQEQGGLLRTGGEVTGRLQEDTLEMPLLCMTSEGLFVLRIALIVVCTAVSGSGLQDYST